MATAEVLRLASKPFLHLVFLSVGWVLAAHPAAAQSAKPASTPAAPAGRAAYESFRLIHTRNVFDPDRRPVRPNRDPGPPPATPRADYVALTGTMINADKSFAFFSGSRSEFNRILVVNDKIANATVTQITALNIEVEREGKRTLVAVGQTVPLDAQSAPGVPPAFDVPPPSTSAAETGETPSAPGAAAPVAAVAAGAPYATGRGGRGRNNNNNNAAANVPAPAAPASSPPPASKLEEIRQRMMKSRQQELK